MKISHRPFPNSIGIDLPVAPIAIALNCARLNCSMQHPIPLRPVPMRFFISPPDVCTPAECLNWFVDHQMDVLDEITEWMIAPRNLN